MSQAPSRTRPKLDRPAVQARISELLAAGPPDAAALLAFAEWIHGKPLAEPALTLTQLKAAVCGLAASRHVATAAVEASRFEVRAMD